MCVLDFSASCVSKYSGSDKSKAAGTACAAIYICELYWNVNKSKEAAVSGRVTHNKNKFTRTNFSVHCERGELSSVGHQQRDTQNRTFLHNKDMKKWTEHNCLSATVFTIECQMGLLFCCVAWHSELRGLYVGRQVWKNNVCIKKSLQSTEAQLSLTNTVVFMYVHVNHTCCVWLNVG